MILSIGKHKTEMTGWRVTVIVYDLKGKELDQF